MRTRCCLASASVQGWLLTRDTKSLVEAKKSTKSSHAILRVLASGITPKIQKRLPTLCNASTRVMTKERPFTTAIRTGGEIFFYQSYLSNDFIARLGVCGDYQIGAKHSPMGSHGLCPYFFIESFYNNFIADNLYDCASHRLAKDLPNNLKLGPTETRTS